jgi:hypothetical protein
MASAATLQSSPDVGATWWCWVRLSYRYRHQRRRASASRLALRFWKDGRPAPRHHRHGLFTFSRHRQGQSCSIESTAVEIPITPITHPVCFVCQRNLAPSRCRSHKSRQYSSHHHPSLNISDSDTPDERRGASWMSASALAASMLMLNAEARYCA